MSVLLVTTNATFLMAYVMFFGTQSDQLACKTFKVVDCGNEIYYSMGILLILLPILFIKSMSKIGYFSIFILIFTFIAIIIIVVICIMILNKSPQEVNDDYGLPLTEEDRTYNSWDWLMIPVFCATMMTLFEGNQQILNLYAEADEPQNFFTIALICIIILTVFIAALVGYLGYLAFGETTKSVILFNLPNEDPASITAKICYVLTIMGSFVIIINPVFTTIERANWYKYCAGTLKEEEQKPKSEAQSNEDGDV